MDYTLNDDDDDGVKVIGGERNEWSRRL